MTSQKCRKLVQHPIATCWQLSIVSPVSRSMIELARPPSLGRDSSTVTAMPREARADAAARPASPPPTITTRRPDSTEGVAIFSAAESDIEVSVSEK